MRHLRREGGAEASRDETLLQALEQAGILLDGAHDSDHDRLHWNLVLLADSPGRLPRAQPIPLVGLR